MHEHDPETVRDEQLGRLLDEARAEQQTRGDVATRSWRAQYPDLAPELVDLLETARALDTAADDWRLLPPAAETTQDALASHPAVLPSAAPTPEHIGRYRVLEQVGAGGMGTVYRAFDPELRREVAVKVPRLNGPEPAPATTRERFLREARAAAAVRHPHVCPIHDVGEHDGVPFVVLAFVPGLSLARWLKDHHRFEDVRAAVTLAVQVAEGLAAVHAHGITHRDLKPGNILLDEAGRALLTDFGLARPSDDSEPLTGPGAVLGTPAYMAPEQAAPATGPTGPRTDLYSLGVVLYQLLTGRLPYEGPPPSLLAQLLEGPPTPPSRHRPDLDPALEGICLKAMARQAQDRYASAQELAEALRQWLAGSGSGSAAAPTPGRPTEMVVESGLPDGSTVKVKVRHDGLAPKQVQISVQEERARARRKRQRWVVSVTVSLAVLVVIVAPSFQWLAGIRFVGPEQATVAPTGLQSAPRAEAAPRELVNVLGMCLVRIKAGTFVMGSPPDENGRDNDEDAHPATIPRPFYLAVCEVTQAEYEQLMGDNPSWFSAHGGGRDLVKGQDTRRFPVENVTWQDAVAFCGRLSQREPGRRYRLPTEAEWEYACRAGTATAFNTGPLLRPDQANFLAAQPAKTSPPPRPGPVGQDPPNAWGLFAMHGNVREWCADVYDENAYQGSSSPKHSEKESRHVCRGGAYLDTAASCRSSARGAADRAYPFIGFRVALDLDQRQGAFASPGAAYAVAMPKR
jgi:eukaryotic-like serine/threonine-protein kinase